MKDAKVLDMYYFRHIKRVVITALLLITLISCQFIGGSSPSIVLNWQQKGTFASDLTLLIDNIIVGGIDEKANTSYIAAYSIQNGRELWRYPSSIQTFKTYRSSFTVFNDKVIHNQGVSVTILTKHGALISNYNFAPTTEAVSIARRNLAVDTGQNIAYLATERTIYALDISDIGNPKSLWNKTFPENLIWDMDISPDGSLLVSLRDGDINFIKLVGKTGEVLWQVGSREKPYHLYKTIDHLEVDNDYIYATNFDKLQSYNLTTGEKRWLSPNLTEACQDNSGQILDFLIVDNIIYATPTSGSCVFAIYKDTGALKWTLSSRVDENAFYTFGGKPALRNGVLYVANGYLWAIDAETGEKITRHNSLDYYSQGAYIQATDSQVLVWGTELRSYALLR